MPTKRAPAVALVGSLMAAIFVWSCAKTTDDKGRLEAPTPASGTAETAPAVADIISRYESLDHSNDSTIKLKASVESQDNPRPEAIQLTIYHKKEPDQTGHYLVDFTAPLGERDRDALINVGPTGEIEAIRYTQSSNSFLTARSAVDEESLFGLTLQELAGGQPEKYDYKLIGEEQYASEPAYRVEGTLKPGAESRFNKTVMLVSKANYTAPLIEAYDSQGQVARRITVAKFQQVDGNWLRWQWTVDNLEGRKKIDFQTVDAKLNQNLQESMFSRDYLKKSAAR